MKLQIHTLDLNPGGLRLFATTPFWSSVSSLNGTLDIPVDFTDCNYKGGLGAKHNLTAIPEFPRDL